jgi:hypothetical protein
MLVKATEYNSNGALDYRMLGIPFVSCALSFIVAIIFYSRTADRFTVFIQNYLYSYARGELDRETLK